MKFLNTTSLDLVSFVGHPPSEYAILSYTWSQPSDELTYHDVHNLSSTGAAGEDWPGRHTAAYHRIVQACHQARACGVRFLWVDSLCVDQSSSADVAESVTASFRLVWDAALCILHLSDLSPAAGDAIPLPDLEKALSRCRSFTRGWTLQELVGARRVEIFDNGWNLRGVKASTSPRPWLEMLSRVSGIDAPVLANRDALFAVSLGRRLSWAARRQTSRPEDAAYALIGICGVEGRLAPRYGEGRRAAFLRLQEKILKTTTDLSILAWRRHQSDDDSSEGDDRQPQMRRPPSSGILADSAADFLHFASHPALGVPFTSDCELTFCNRGLCVRTLLSVSSHQPGVGREVVLMLNASYRSRLDSIHIGISLREVEPGIFVRSNPQGIVCLPLRKGETTLGRVCVRLDIDGREAGRTCVEERESRVSGWMNKVSERKVHSSASRPTMAWLDSNMVGLANTDALPVWPAALQGQRPPRREAATGDAAVESTGHSDPTSSPRSRRPSKRGADEMLESDDRASDSSSEDDVLLFDSLPEKPERLEDGHSFQLVLPDLVTLGLSAWREEKAAAATRANKKLTPPAATCTTSRLTLGSLSFPFRPPKRARRGDERQEGSARGGDSGESYTAETDRDEPDVFLVRPKHDTRSGRLACPFYKLDSVRYHSCMWEIELPDTRTIKQHVIVDHRLPEYCPVCHAVFDSAKDRDRHIAARTCSRREAPTGLLVGVSEDQVEKLARRDDGKEWEPKAKWRGGAKARDKTKEKAAKPRRRTATLSKEQRWFRIWEILFPGMPRPESVYLSAPREREAAAFRRFWSRTGAELVASVLEERGLLQWEDSQEEVALAALHASVLKGMMEESGLAFPVEGGGDDVGAGGTDGVGSGLTHTRKRSSKAI